MERKIIDNPHVSAMKIFKLFALTLLLCSVNSVAAQEHLQRVYAKAYEYVKNDNPSKAVCANDSIYDLDWCGCRLVEKKAQEEIELYHVMKRFQYDEPQFSPVLHEAFRTAEMSEQPKYTVVFTEPYLGMICCEVLPIPTHKIGILGEPIISCYLFRFWENGEIYQISKDYHQIHDFGSASPGKDNPDD